MHCARIRHGTSISHPDGCNTPIVGTDGGRVNHLYEIFTAGNERIVNAGRTRAANVTPSPADVSMRMVVDQDHDNGTLECGVHNPTTEDADPDVWPPVKDGSECDWMEFWSWMRDERLKSALHGRIPRKRQRE
jgi:hypothetical protein